MGGNIGMYILWIIIFIIAVGVELSTQMQLGWSGAGAALVALITHGITGGNPIWIEFVAFATVWIIIWAVFILFIKKIRNSLHDKEDGYMGYIDKTYIALKSNIKSEYGEVKIDGKIFRYNSLDKIDEGEEVKVISIKGNTIKVKKVGK